jgi:pyrimidine-specific ribonucleoside hydrolase
MRLLLTCVFLLFLKLLTTGQVNEAKHPSGKLSIIIDTDCGFDDFKAIAILLSHPEIEITSVIVSDGSLAPSEGVKKIKALLHEYAAGQIIVTSDYAKSMKAPAWRSFCEAVRWGNHTNDTLISEFRVAMKILDTQSSKRYTLVCLGPLNSAEKIRTLYPSLYSKIDRIVWYNESASPLRGYNFECDKAAAESIINAGEKRIDIISDSGKPSVFNSSMFKPETKLAEVMSSVFNQAIVKEHLSSGYCNAGDELVAFYLLSPESFQMDMKKTSPGIRYSASFNRNILEEIAFDLLSGTYSNERNVVFSSFPSKREMFSYDVRQILDTTIARYGKDEWKACVMTDEFHGHLGVFSIVGAKMGIRAREYFGVGVDNLRVISFAGTKPPYSCMNDGIQVSTGATLGMGTISVSSDSNTRPEAIFTCNGKSIRIKLKEEYLKIVDNDIKEGIVKYGLSDDGYWKMVRQSALRYWMEWDRWEIFEVEEIGKN